MPRALINKVGSMQLKKKKGSVSREREILRKKNLKKTQKNIQRIKNTATEVRMPLMGLRAD